MERIVSIVKDLMPQAPFDALGVGIIDFGKNQFEALEVTQVEGKLFFNSRPVLYFDLASLTKPLTNSLSYFLSPESFDALTLLCLNHRGGLPAWGLLPNPGWREQILNYSICESDTLYSDFSALRVMLELEKKNIFQKELCQKVWDQETVFWTDLPTQCSTPQYGFKNSLPSRGQVHDPNAWVIQNFCSHAGLYSTVPGLCRTLLEYQKQTDFIEKVEEDLKTHSRRFSFGWDRVENFQTTLAGEGCGPLSFGHLGFTGTSIWIDPQRKKGHVILSNATKLHWYNKSALNELRRAIGQWVWAQN